VFTNQKWFVSCCLRKIGIMTLDRVHALPRQPPKLTQLHCCQWGIPSVGNYAKLSILSLLTLQYQHAQMKFKYCRVQ
jgi:hypothetical protein